MEPTLPEENDHIRARSCFNIDWSKLFDEADSTDSLADANVSHLPSDYSPDDILPWVREEIARSGDGQRDRYRAVANELFIRAQADTRFRDLLPREVFLKIARGIEQVQAEIAREAKSKMPEGKAKSLVGLVTGTLSTVADARERPDAVLAQLDRLAELRKTNPAAWEAYLLAHFAGRREEAELEEWLGDKVYDDLVEAEYEVIGVGH